MKKDWKRSIRKNYRVARELIRLRFQNLMVFRLDFFAPFFCDGSLFLVQLLAFRAIYANVDTVGSWGRGEMIIYIGTFSLLNALSMTVCFFGLMGVQGKVLSGEMDLYLSKPVSPLLRLTFEKVNPGSVPLILMSLCIIGWGIAERGMTGDGIATNGIAVGWRSICAYVFWVVLMEILYYELEVLMRSMSFYVLSKARLDQLEDACLDMCMKLPGIAFYGIYKFIFYFLLPYGIMATLPVQSLIGEMNLRIALEGIGVAAVFAFLTYLAWTRGIRRYDSASS